MIMKDYVCVDIETTGIRSKWDRIIEIGAVRIRDGEAVGTFSKLINPGIRIPAFITQLTGITDDMLAGRESIESVLPEFVEFAGDDYLLGHNVMFDYGFLKQNAANLNIPFEKSGLDTLKIARKVLPALESRALDFLCGYYHIEEERHHRAHNDAYVTSQLYGIFLKEYGEKYPQLFEPQKFIAKTRKMVPITDKQKRYLNDLNTRYKITPDYDINELTKNEASRKIDKIFSQKR